MKTRHSKMMLLTMMLAFAAVMLFPMNAMAAKTQKAAKTSTYVLDAKSGVGYQTAIRITTNGRYNTTAIYLPSAEYSVTAKGSGLITKVTGKDDAFGEYSYFSTDALMQSEEERAQFKSRAEVTVFTPKDGTYTLNLTVKNGKKQVLKKKIKVYAGYTEAIEKISYAGKEFAGSDSLLSAKASGKLSIKVGKDFKLKKIEIGSFDANGEEQFITVKNNKSIKLSTQKSFKQVNYTYGFDEPDGYAHESGHYVDYIHPETMVRVTVLDTKLKIERTVYRYIFKK